MMTLEKAIGVEGPALSVVDVGALPIDGEPPYLAMARRGLCRVVGFEPQREAWEKLGRGEIPPWLTVHYDLVADGSPKFLHICEAAGMTSMYPPDPTALAAFFRFEEFGRRKESVTLPSVTLDQLDLLPDFIKIDAQGAELAVLQASPLALASAAVVQLEVSFVPLYVGQPTFAEVDRFMRESGFMPHTFANIKTWQMTPMPGATRRPNQLLEADVVYIRDVVNLHRTAAFHLRAMAMILHYCYGSFDVAGRCVEELARRGNCDKNAGRNYCTVIHRDAGRTAAWGWSSR